MKNIEGAPKKRFFRKKKRYVWGREVRSEELTKLLDHFEITEADIKDFGWVMLYDIYAVKLHNGRILEVTGQKFCSL